MSKTFDFSGWATKNDLRCSDGRIIRKNAFRDNDGRIVPLVWNHQHNDPGNVLGHALLENRDEGVYAYCSFNDTEVGQNAKRLVEHGDVFSLSIYANQLKQNGSDVIHGAIREVSLVLAGANPGAYIDFVMAHSEDGTEEAIIYADQELSLEHAEKEEPVEETKEEPKKENEEMPNKDGEKTVQDVFNSLTEEQKTVVYALIGQAIEDAKNGGADEEGEDMKHNVFDYDEEQGNVLSHSDLEAVFSDAKRYGSLKESALAHGIDDIELLFPDAQGANGAPEFIKREDSWVKTVLDACKHTPFSRVKSLFADITEDEARAKGYLHTYTRSELGNKVDSEGQPVMKKEEVFTLLKRTTTPTTIYKKQKLDRDDVIDITDFDVVAWLKGEMRAMLEEELARAVLVGDGRLASDDDKINPLNIRPIVGDDALYTIHKNVEFAASTSIEDKAKALIKEAVRARKLYKGSGSPTCYINEDILTEMLLLEDAMGHRLYKSETELASALRVKNIVSVPVLTGATYEKDSKTFDVEFIIVNLADYNIGADKGGSVNMFDDFDIDYNAQKYLIETRCSGALVKPYSAIVVGSAANT